MHRLPHGAPGRVQLLQWDHLDSADLILPDARDDLSAHAVRLNDKVEQRRPTDHLDHEVVDGRHLDVFQQRAVHELLDVVEFIALLDVPQAITNCFRRGTLQQVLRAAHQLLGRVRVAHTLVHLAQHAASLLDHALQAGPQLRLLLLQCEDLLFFFLQPRRRRARRFVFILQYLLRVRAHLVHLR